MNAPFPHQCNDDPKNNVPAVVRFLVVIPQLSTQMHNEARHEQTIDIYKKKHGLHISIHMITPPQRSTNDTFPTPAAQRYSLHISVSNRFLLPTTRIKRNPELYIGEVN